LIKIETSGASFSSCADRFCTQGYRVGLSPMEQLAQLGKIEGLSGIPLMVPLEYESLELIERKLTAMGKTVGTIAPDTYIDPKWKNGSLMNRDSGLRREMVALIKQCMDISARFAGSDVLLWLANDGYDYPFEDDYALRFDYLMDSLSELAEYRADVKLSIEYKSKEPRTHQYISDYGKALFICEKLGYQNLGVVVDIGHSLFAGENPSEAVAITNKYGRLFHIHLNDNYRSWDDDLIVGSVHFWETLEMFYQLRRIGYDGWFTLDIWPSRVDGFKALTESVARTNMFASLAQKLPEDQFTRIQADNAVPDIMKILRETCIKEGSLL